MGADQCLTHVDFIDPKLLPWKGRDDRNPEDERTYQGRYIDVSHFCAQPDLLCILDWTTRSVLPTQVHPFNIPTPHDYSDKPPTETRISTRLRTQLPLNSPLPDGQPYPRYGYLHDGETVAAFRYQRSISHLRELGFEFSRDRGTMVVGVMRRENEKFCDTFPEWIVVGKAISGTTAKEPGLILVMKPVDIEGRPIGRYKVPAMSPITMAEIYCRGYFFPPFDRLLLKDMVWYLLYLAKHDQPPISLPKYVE